MKKIFARIGMELEVSDEEWEQLLEEAGGKEHGESNEFDINADFAKRFIKDGHLSDNSYIPEGCIYSEV